MVDTLPPTVRRVVTTHTIEGKAVVWKDEEVKAHPIKASTGGSVGSDGKTDASGALARFAHVWTTDKFPYDNADTRDLALEESGNKLSHETGTVLRIVDLPPHSDSPFHRTQSLDYGIVMEGDVVLVLDDNREVKMKRGDVCVQRGTIHGWRNYTDSWGRVYFVLLGAEPLVIDGKKLGDAGYQKV